MQSDFAHCERLVREADKDRFLASLFAPADRRPGLHALYAFDLEIAAIGGRVHEPLAGHIRLQWWREVLQGERASEALANPVAAALLEALAQARLAPGGLDALLDARLFDIHDEPMHTLSDLEDYALKTAGAVMHASAGMLGAGDATVAPIIAQAAPAVLLTDVLHRFAGHAVEGRIYVPDDVLGRHGASRDDILAGRSGVPLLAALSELRDHAQRRCEAALALMYRLPARARPAFLQLAVVPLALARMQGRRYDPFRTVIEVPQWRRQWAIWRAARR